MAEMFVKGDDRHLSYLFKRESICQGDFSLQKHTYGFLILYRVVLGISLYNFKYVYTKRMGMLFNDFLGSVSKSIQMDVSIIIVSYNTRKVTNICLESIYKYTKGIEYEIIVSDNGSSDGSIEMIRSSYPNVLVIENNANLGFGAANNIALKRACGKYVLFLNSDTYLLNNAVKIFFDYWDNAEDKDFIGAIGCWLRDENGNYIHSGGYFPTYFDLLKRQLRYNAAHLAKGFIELFHLYKLYPKYVPLVEHGSRVGTLSDIDYVTGADLFMRNDEFAVFDEAFFMYYEENDMQLRLARRGFKRRLIPEAQICHLEKKRNDKLPVATFADLHMERSSIIYARKNLDTKAKLLKLLVKLDWVNPFVNKFVKQYNIKL